MKDIFRRNGERGFTMVELIMVMVIMGVVSAVGAARFFDKRNTDTSQYLNQAKSIIRYGQKVAIAQHRNVFVKVGASSVGLCYQAVCTAANVVPAPGGGNSGNAVTKAQCVLGSPATYVPNWMCEGMQTDISTTIASNPALTNGMFYFDDQGRPYNTNDTAPTSTFGTTSKLTLSIAGGTSSMVVTVTPETGYVY